MSENKNQYDGQGTQKSRLDQRHTVMVVTDGKAAFRRYGDLGKDVQTRIDDAVDIVCRKLREARDADPTGDLAVEPFQEKLWCKVGVQEGAIGAGCGIFGYWCSVWVHPEKGVAANCGSIN